MTLKTGNNMSDYNEQVMKLITVIKDKPFLFPKTMPQRLKFSLYFEWFEKHNKHEFAQMPAMVHFHPDILDQYSKNIVWTGFSSTDGHGGNHCLHTLVQVNPDQHIIFLYAQENNQPSVIGTLYLKNVNDYLKFMQDNDFYIVRKQIGGFVPFRVTSPEPEFDITKPHKE